MPSFNNNDRMNKIKDIPLPSSKKNGKLNQT